MFSAWQKIYIRWYDFLLNCIYKVPSLVGFPLVVIMEIRHDFPGDQVSTTISSY